MQTIKEFKLKLIEATKVGNVKWQQHIYQTVGAVCQTQAHGSAFQFHIFQNDNKEGRLELHIYQILNGKTLPLYVELNAGADILEVALESALKNLENNIGDLFLSLKPKEEPKLEKVKKVKKLPIANKAEA